MGWIAIGALVVTLFWRWLKRLGFLVLLFVITLGAPVVYVETMCRGDDISEIRAMLLPSEHRRQESRTFMTYPEWHIVHTYDDYAKVISTEDPHDFKYLRGITGYWTSLCALTKTAAKHGGVNGETKQLVYVIGISFTIELALKAAYEETAGRMATLFRGIEHTSLDDLSAVQATDYAKFLQQVPWYKWDFSSAATALDNAATSSLRDQERNFALGLENRGKASYASLIAAAVANIGADELTLRMIVTGASQKQLANLEDVAVITTRPEGIEIETPRYRTLTHLMSGMAENHINFVEIAGNDDILFTALSKNPSYPDAIHSFARQGYGDYRHLIVVKVQMLSETLRSLPVAGLTLEHIHDY